MRGGDEKQEYINQIDDIKIWWGLRYQSEKIREPVKIKI
jgi:hypothetical protein